MITALKSRKKLLLHKHYFILAKLFFFFRQSHNYYKRKNLDIRQENTKNPEIKFTFLPFSTVFQSLKQKLNTNQIYIQYKKIREFVESNE